MPLSAPGRVYPAAVTDRRRLVVASFLMLFAELVLIRWLGASIVYLSYFSTLVLLGSFLGIGIGFLRGGAKPDLFRWALVVMGFFIAFVQLFPVVIDRSGSALVFFGSTTRRGLPIWLMLPVVFSAVALIMTCIAQGAARLFRTLEPLEAYRLDIIGSLLGIGLFAVLSFLKVPPVGWGLVIAGSYLVVLGRRRADRVAVVGAAAVALLLGLGSLQSMTTWSPYYKVSVIPVGTQPAGYEIDVNGIWHQSILSSDLRLQLEPTYGLTYERLVDNPLSRVLIIGAGSGNDVAIALRAGAQHVDAVEIDPQLQELGRQLHPDHPYQDPRVTAIVDDGRAFLERTDRTYDLILFALPDSLTLVSGQSSLRLESYLFTREAITSAADHLAPGGAFGMYNYYREIWLVDRLAGTLQEVFDRPPCLDTRGSGGGSAGFSLLMDAPAAGSLSCAHIWDPGERSVPAPATDDHPFVYLRSRSIPGLYLAVLAFILALSVVTVRVAGPPLRSMRPFLDLFFMGAAFLLLETKNVVQFALLFGTTWFVNALVFAGILVTVLAAIETARRVRVRRPSLLWLVLACSIGVAWLVPAQRLLGLAMVPRFLLATALAFAPVYVANLIFADRFRDVADSAVGFGANLLGAMVGGVLEYLSLLVGYRALLLVAAALYGLAFVASRRHAPAAEGAPERRVPVRGSA
jgi:hypothetical protein